MKLSVVKWDLVGGVVGIGGVVVTFGGVGMGIGGVMVTVGGAGVGFGGVSEGVGSVGAAGKVGGCWE